MSVFTLEIKRFRVRKPLPGSTPVPKLAHSTFQGISGGAIGVLLFSGLAGALLLPSAFSHTDAGITWVLSLLMVCCHSLVFGVCKDVLSLRDLLRAPICFGFVT